jgi:hypothetical protein
MASTQTRNPHRAWIAYGVGQAVRRAVARATTSMALAALAAKAGTDQQAAMPRSALQASAILAVGVVAATRAPPRQKPAPREEYLAVGAVGADQR